MRHRKPTQTTQVNVRLDTALVLQLEKRAKENRTTFSEIIRTLLTDGLAIKPEPSLNSFRVYFTSRLRDLVEAGAPKQDIEQAWATLRAVEALFAKFYGDIETQLSPYVRIAQVRELLRGSPSKAAG